MINSPHAVAMEGEMSQCGSGYRVQADGDEDDAVGDWIGSSRRSIRTKDGTPIEIRSQAKTSGSQGEVSRGELRGPPQPSSAEPANPPAYLPSGSERKKEELEWKKNFASWNSNFYCSNRRRS